MMENFKLTNDVKSLWELNKDFAGYNIAEAMNARVVEDDLKLLQQYVKKYHRQYRNSKPSLGDCLRLPDGQTVYVCHVYDDWIQTCQGGSFALTPLGYISYSGGLDRGISISDIVLTKKKHVLRIWFPHAGYLKARCAVDADIACRMWETREGADLSGIPQVKRLRRQKLKEQSETVTKTDLNGFERQEHLPEILIHQQRVTKELLNEIKQTTGLEFEDAMHFVPVYWCQPMTLEQILTLKRFTQFSLSEEHDPINHAPLLTFRLNPTTTISSHKN